MKYFIFLLLCLPGVLQAQDESKYLRGSVPVVNGKVTFTQILEAPMLSDNQIFSKVMGWAEKRFAGQDGFKSRILYSNAEKGEIACLGEEYLVFADKALSLDRAKVMYQLLLETENGKCEAKITSIRYFYESENLLAENTITDEHALYKNKNKLIRQPGKFRTHTIDMAGKIFSDLQLLINPLGSVPTTPVAATTAPPPSVPAASSVRSVSPAVPSTLQGFRQISPEQIPGNIIKLLSQDWMLITAGDAGKYNTMTASWGGLGHLYGKPVSFCFINPARYTYQFMEKGGTYTLTFYTETYRDALQFCGTHSGKDTDKVKATGLTPIVTPTGTPAYAEAWLILECRKMVSQSFTPEALSDEKLHTEWSGKAMHKMYIGEILNVWVK